MTSGIQTDSILYKKLALTMRKNMLNVRIALVFTFIVAICSSQGYRLNVKDVTPGMVDEVIASAERSTGASFAYSRPYPYMHFGRFGMPYGYNLRPIPGFGQIQEPILSVEEPREQIISESEEPDPEMLEEEPIIEKGAIEGVPIIIEIPVEEIIGEVDESQINEPDYVQNEPVFYREL